MEGCRLARTFALTIGDIIQRDAFKNAKVIAGKQGLSRQVRWTHILETNEFESLIDGGELILTTGAGLNLNSSAKLTYMRNLINRKASGICVEIGTHISHISNDIIQLANQYQFPIIIFDHFVKFVDITQDLHAQIINQHHQMLSQLNEMSTRFNELSLLPNGILKILQELHAYLTMNVFYITNESEAYYYPPETGSLKEKIRQHALRQTEQQQTENFISLEEGNFAFVPVKGLGQIWGYLYLQVKENTLQDFIFSVMDRAAVAIAQIMLRNRTIEERKQNTEDRMVRNLLHGKDYDSDTLQTILPYSPEKASYRLVLIQSKQPEINQDYWNEIKLQRSIMFRSLLKQHGYTPAISVGKNEIAIIAFFKKKEGYSAIDTAHFSQLVQAIKDIREENLFSGEKCTFGVSKVNDCLHRMTESYQEAKKVLSLQSANITSSKFYEHIGIYRLLLFQQNDEQLTAYIQDHLRPLLNYDDETKSELLKTLEVYLDCGGSKKEAAEQLFIVRQTLYHRLRKIEELLGEDFMDPVNRLALETAIKAYYLTKATS